MGRASCFKHLQQSFPLSVADHEGGPDFPVAQQSSILQARLLVLVLVVVLLGRGRTGGSAAGDNGCAYRSGRTLAPGIRPEALS